MLSLSHGAPRVLHSWHRSISDSTASARAVAVSEAVRTARCTASPPAAPRQPSPLTGGQAQGHAGAVTMAARRDALAAAAEVMVWLERRCGGHSLDDVPPEALEDPSLVCTVGEVGVHPGVSNVIARYANISVDIRRAPWGCSDRVGYWVRCIPRVLCRSVPQALRGGQRAARSPARRSAGQRQAGRGRTRAPRGRVRRDDVRQRVVTELVRQVDFVCRRRGVECTAEVVHAASAVACDPGMMRALQSACIRSQQARCFGDLRTVAASCAARRCARARDLSSLVLLLGSCWGLALRQGVHARMRPVPVRAPVSGFDLAGECAGAGTRVGGRREPGAPGPGRDRRGRHTGRVRGGAPARAARGRRARPGQRRGARRAGAGRPDQGAPQHGAQTPYARAPSRLGRARLALTPGRSQSA